MTTVQGPPTITDITNQTIDEDGATVALPFTIGDVETPAASLTVTASSSDQTLVPDANIVAWRNGRESHDHGDAGREPERRTGRSSR